MNGSRQVAILDYDAGNLTSVERAVRHLGFEGRVTRDPEVIRAAERVIFPGVGAAGASMENLCRLGLADELRRALLLGKPVLGICIACQVIFEESDEDGGTPCLGLLPGRVARFPFAAGSPFKVPHMGWNAVSFKAAHPLLEGLQPRGRPPCQFYFVHSYYVRPSDPKVVLGTAEYGGLDFPAVVGRDNLAAVQFHAEKSGRPGLKLLENFLSWNP
jgi:glutamine amidotransferase